MKTTNDALAADFVRFVKSTQGQAIVAQSGLITVEEGGTGNYAPLGSLSGQRLTLSGSTSLERVIERLREAFIALNPGVRVEVNYNGSSAGINDCRNGRSVVAMSSRALRDAEKEVMNDFTFAHDGIAVIVHRDNAINGMTSDQVTRIFKGEVRHWD